MSGEMIAIVTVTLVGVFLTSLKRTIQSFRQNCLRELGKIKTVQLVGMAVTPLLVTALLAACTEQPTSPISTHRAEPSNKYWVTSDRLDRHTCPSTDCGIVGQLFFREETDVFEDKDGWARVSRYYDASCANGRSEYVNSGNSRCDPENGIVDGKFAEWVVADFLSEDRPSDPAADAAGLEALLAGSDDFQKYRSAFAQTAESLISSGQCREEDFREWGGLDEIGK